MTRRSRSLVTVSLVQVAALTLGPALALAQAPAAAKPPATAKPAAAAPEAPAESRWPATVTAGSTTLTIYQPQVDSFNGYELLARAAVSAKEGEAQPTFGIVHVKARAIVDKGTRLVALDRYEIVKADFPSAEEKAVAWMVALQKDATNRTRSIALDRLEAMLGVAEAERKAEDDPVKNDPPKILFSSVPAMLVYIDGAPAYRAEPGTSLQRVVNTRPLILKDAQGRHYLHVFDGWLAAPDLDGPYEREAKPPAELATAQKAAVESRQVDLLTGQTSKDDKAPTLAAGPIPAIVVATTPTELIVTDGEPKWVPIEGTRLLYVENTTGHVFKEIEDQKTYALVSGRWFRSADPAKGGWQFVAANELPKDFPAIPDESAKENVKASIAGTQQAREAAIAAEVPQTTVVKKAEVKATPPVYDGEPQLKAISGTSLQYVVNTATPVIMVDDKSWYAVENGVWFVATSAKGPWIIASSVPAVIYSIPKSSSLHYVTYVKVYDSTPESVVVGYTPGYQGSCVDPVTQVVVYGTGYSYVPWVGTYWYGPPVTYGFGVAVRYTPYTGWGFGYGFGWSWGYATVAVGWGWGAYPWWGPYGYGYGWGPPLYAAPYAWGGVAYGYRGGAVAWGPGGWAGTTGNIYSQWGPRSTVSRASGGYNAWTGNAWASRVGTSYNSRTGVASAGQRGAVSNIYTGDYAAGGRGVARGPGGTVAAGSRGTVGNAYTGREVTGSRGAVYNPRTGEGTSYGSIRGENGGVARFGDDVYAGRDGNVYRRNEGGGWEQANRGGGWSNNANPPSSLNRESAARSAGSARTSGYRQSYQGMSRSGGMRGGGGRRR